MTSFQHDYSRKTESERNREEGGGTNRAHCGARAGGAAPAVVRGLSTAHISPQHTHTPEKYTFQPAKLETWRGAHRVKVSHGHYQIPQNGGGPRGEVTLFSRQSRKRLMDLLGMIDKEEKPLFLTLTYPKEFTADSRTWKRDLDTFFKRMRRKYPKSSAIWKLEPQKRGAPHYHLFVWGIGYHDLIIWVGKNWYEVVGSGDIKHLRAGTSVENVRSWRGIRSYASKYMGKVFDMPMMKDLGWSQPGRFWGVYGRQNLPQVVATVLEIMTEKEVFDMLRYLRRYSGIKGRKYRSLSIICENPERWEALLQ